MPNFEELKDQLIVALCDWSLKPDSKAEFSENFASSLISVGPGIGRQIIRALRSDSMIRQINVNPDLYEITRSLIERAAAIQEFLGPITAPASDRIVRLDDNNPEYKETIETIKKLQKALDGNNYYKENEPDDYAQRDQELKALTALLAAPRASISKIEAFGYGTLSYLATKFADEPIGELAKLAWQFLKALISG